MTESPSGAVLRRALDVTVSAVSLVPLAPVMGVIALLIRRDGPGPAVFRQVRVGRYGRAFVMYKFRTMRADGSEGPGITHAGDQRVTRVGTWLRSTKLDELPQLVNVLKGDMSLVGPRPELAVYVREWQPAQRAVILSVRPGITDPVTVTLRREEELLGSVPDPESYYRTVLLPQKADSYARYVRSRTLAGDLLVLLRTLRHVVFE